MLSAENYLRDCHDRQPGATSRCFGTVPARRDGIAIASSYACLTSLVPHTDTPGVVLDLACGDGFLLQQLAQRRQLNLALIGVDMSDGELRHARMRLGDDAQLLNARAQCLPLASATVDFVLCHLALMLMDDVESVIAEIRRVLKPGGVFSAVVGASPVDGDAFQIWVDLLRPAMVADCVPGLRIGDARARSVVGLQGLLGNGFADIQIQDLQLRCDADAASIWDWFSHTYDVDRMSLVARAALRAQFLQAVQPLADANGIVPCTERLRQVTALAVQH